MTEKLKAILAANERYADFKILDAPAPFAEWAKDKDYPTVQLHDTTVYKWDGGADIVGFAGVFAWEDNQLTSLDGDTYNPDMPVVGYEEFDGGVDILVKGGEW